MSPTTHQDQSQSVASEPTSGPVTRALRKRNHEGQEPVPTQPKKKTRQDEVATPTSNQAQPTSSTATLQKRKKNKKTTQDNNATQGIQGAEPTMPAQTQVPPTPAQGSIAPQSSAPVIPAALSNDQNQSNEKQRPKRKKANSDVAQKVQDQETEKQSKQAAKASRQAKKAKQTVVQETPEETQAFVERARLEAGAQPLASNIQIEDLQPTITKKGKKKGNESIIAQRVMQRLFSPAPTAVSTSTSTSGPSESVSAVNYTPSVSSVNPPLRSHSRQSSYQPAMDTSMLSTSTSATSATHLGDCAVGFDISICLKGIPKLLAPLISHPEPLPGDVRTPRRIVSNSSQTSKSRKNTKLAVKEVAEGDRTIISAALNRLEVLVMTHNPFPSESNFRALAAQANAWACRKFNKGNLKLTPDSDYESLLHSRLSGMRSTILKQAKQEVPMAYHLKSSAEDSTGYNQLCVKNLLENGNYTSPLDKPDNLYEHPIFVTILKLSFFHNPGSLGPTHRDLWQCITIPCLAGIATAVEKVLMEYESGERVALSFTAKNFSSKYYSHVAALSEMYKANPQHLQGYCKSVADQLLKPFNNFTAPTPFESIQPRIPISVIASRYAQLKSTNSGSNVTEPTANDKLVTSNPFVSNTGNTDLGAWRHNVAIASTGIAPGPMGSPLVSGSTADSIECSNNSRPTWDAPSSDDGSDAGVDNDSDNNNTGEGAKVHPKDTSSGNTGDGNAGQRGDPESGDESTDEEEGDSNDVSNGTDQGKDKDRDVNSDKAGNEAGESESEDEDEDEDEDGDSDGEGTSGVVMPASGAQRETLDLANSSDDDE